MSDAPARDPLAILAGFATPPDEYVSKLPKGKEDKSRRASCSTCGGYHDPSMFHLDYVGHADVTRILLDADPQWNWEPVATTAEGLPLMERDSRGNAVGLWIRLTVGGVTRLGYGSCEAGKAEAEKELIGDALRNAAMRFGVALGLWSKSDAGEGGRETAPDRTPPRELSAQHRQLMADLDALLAEAEAAGAKGDPDKARRYASASPAHAEKAIETVKQAMAEVTDGQDVAPPAEPSEGGDAPPSSPPSEALTWRDACVEYGVKPEDVLIEVVKGWPNNDTHRKPKKTGDLDRLVPEDEDVAGRVREAINTVAERQEANA